MKLIVYHIYCVGNYLEIVKSQIDRLKSSGLFQWCDVMEVSCVDIEDKYEGIDELFEGMGKVNLFKTPQNTYEYWGINKVWEISQKHEGQVFYLHSKGVSNTYKNKSTGDISQWKIEGINLWRNALEYHLIDNYSQCLKDLKKYDTCGLTNVNNWYWGNFWWANLSYIRENEKPSHGDRWYFEAWLHYARHYKGKEYFHFEWNPYFTNLPLDIYIDKDFLKNKKIKIISGLFGTTGIQQDEGYPDDYPIFQVDVTDKIKQNLETNNGQMINIKVDKDTLGDVMSGFRKFLVMVIEIDEKPYRITYNEGFFVDLKFN